jgi:hypothetical protein
VRVTAAFSRLLRLPGVWVRKVRFESDRVIVEVALCRRRLICPECGYSSRATSENSSAQESPAQTGNQGLTLTTSMPEDPKMGSALPDDLRQLARALGADHPVPGLPRRCAPRDLHHQLDRSAAPPAAQDHQDPRALPHRRRRAEADLPRDHQSRDQMAARVQLAGRAGRVQDRVRRPHPRQRNLRITH